MWVVGEAAEAAEAATDGVAGACVSRGVGGDGLRRAGWISDWFGAADAATIVGGGVAGVGVVGRSTGCVISNESEVLDRALMLVGKSKLAFGEAGLFA